ncbi:hypothetical protein [Paenibacillus protaetiae]|uniref:Uncharacterized protein n=1 Tax=Paenibacillus protaetiae TaxID=2509456 RepID=A0A4P6EU39_9BACL|nr:hypothetical protein [Paenibacillus protaetiae]QAY66424.1 hypothetical protein ET464_08385 [Paenibacillus protaetiae]
MTELRLQWPPKLNKNIFSAEWLVIIICGLLMNAIVFAFVFLPARDGKQNAQMQMQSSTDHLRSVEAHYMKPVIAEDEASRLARVLPSSSADSSIVLIMRRLAGEMKVSIGGIEQQPAEGDGGQKAPDGVQAAVFDIHSAGHLDRLIAFMDALQQQQRLFAVTSIVLDRLEPSGYSGYPELQLPGYLLSNRQVYSLRITVTAYAMPDHETAAR